MSRKLAVLVGILATLLFASPAVAITPGQRHYDRHYRSGGFGYEAKRGRWKRWVRDHYIGEFGLRPGQSLLDIPCGDGFWSSLFAELGFNVTGVDLSEGGIEVARRQYLGVPFVVGNAEQLLPVPEGSFDIVFSRSITHLHQANLFTERSDRMVRNLMRYVRPGGLLLVSYYTLRDGTMPATGHHANHRLSDLVRLLEPAGDVFHVAIFRNFVQLGVQHPNAPWRGRRRRSLALRAAGRVGSLAVRTARALARRPLQ
jgi:SAM-dependent methyltransferase